MDLPNEAIDRWEDRFDELVDGLRERLGLRDPLRILPYRGYSDGSHLRLKGRVLEGDTKPVRPSDTLWDDLVRWFRRVESDEFPEARLVARWDAVEEELETNLEGFFLWQPEDGPQRGDTLRWESVELEMRQPVVDGEPATAQGQVLVPAADARVAVVSDLDDTVIRTGADDTLRMARTIFLNNARTRTAFPGVGAFYRALQGEKNPIFYVSSSPWNYYELFDQFLEFQGIPAGPIFLKDFGIDDNHLVKPDHGEHKPRHIRRLMDQFPDLDFVLLGDSGQQDAEIYLELAKELGERMRVVYIREVTGDDRAAELDQRVAEAADHGVEMVRVRSTVEAARHAAEAGLVDEAAVDEVEAEKKDEEARDD